MSTITIKSPQFFSQFVRDIKEKINQKLFKKFELPWMKSKELDVLTELLFKLNPKVCFEWGSGFSTLYFPTVFPSINKWYSIEHNEDWYKQISARVTDPRVILTFVQMETPPALPHSEKYRVKGDGTYQEFKSYVDFPASLNIKFDFILIDGRARKDCLRKAFDLISDEGVVMVHDANRDNYLVDLPPFGFIQRFKDYRKKRGGVLLVSKKRDVATVLDVEKHQAAWKNHDILAKVLMMR